MFTNEEAQYLISLEKVLKDPLLEVDLTQKKNRIYLISPNERNYEFFIEVTANHKISFKTTLHHQEALTNIGLLRVDFKGTHQNPAEINNFVPEELKPYVGKWFTINEPHMHFYVEGYKPLAWAIPLKLNEFGINEDYSNVQISDLLLTFARKINVTSIIKIHDSLF